MLSRVQGLWMVSVIVLTIGFVGCGGQKEAIPTKGRPGWIDKGSGFFTGDRGRAFYGVGAASNISTPIARSEGQDGGVFSGATTHAPRDEVSDLSGGTGDGFPRVSDIPNAPVAAEGECDQVPAPAAAVV